MTSLHIVLILGKLETGHDKMNENWCFNLMFILLLLSYFYCVYLMFDCYLCSGGVFINVSHFTHYCWNTIFAQYFF